MGIAITSTSRSRETDRVLFTRLARLRCRLRMRGATLSPLPELVRSIWRRVHSAELPLSAVLEWNGSIANTTSPSRKRRFTRAVRRFYNAAWLFHARQNRPARERAALRRALAGAYAAIELRFIHEEPALSAHEETRPLIERITRLRNRIAELHLPLAIHTASRARRPISLEHDDLVQEACLGLLRAVEMFDVSRGYCFSTYACRWLDQSIRRALQDKDALVRVPPSALRRGAAYSVAIPVSEELGGADGTTPLDQLLAVERQDATRRAMVHLEPRLAKVIAMRLHGRTLKQVGQHLGVTRERVRQLQGSAVRKLHGDALLKEVA